MEKTSIWEPIILAAVVVGAFPISYIITTYVMRKDNRKEGYPRHLSGGRISA
jgi:hypothetical protein